MAEINHCCSAEGCGKSATVFGIKEAIKFRSCEEHISSLLSKKVTIYNIDGYDFISCPRDAPEFEERKTTIEKGLGNLSFLEVNVNAEYEAALQLLDLEKIKLLHSLDLLFSRIRNTVAMRHSEVTQHFASLAVNLNLYIKRRENALMPIAESLCSEIKGNPMFIQLAITDISDSFVNAFNKLWSVSNADIDSILISAVSIALKPDITEANSHYQKGLDYLNSKMWKEAEECFLLAKKQYEAYDPLSKHAAINLNELGSLLTDRKRCNEAKICHQQAQDIFDRIDPQSEEAAQNHFNFGKLYNYLDQFEEAEQHYQQATRICEISQTNTLALALRGLGIIRKKEKRFGEAEQYFRQAEHIFLRTDSQSVNAAYNYYLLGFVCEKLKQFKEAETNYLRARAIYEIKEPQSLKVADCFHELGVLYEAQNRLEDSINSYQSAVTLYALISASRQKTESERAIRRVQGKLR